MNPVTIAIVFIVGAVGGIFGDKIVSNFFIDQNRPIIVQKKEEIIIKENEAFEHALKKNIPLLASIDIKNPASGGKPPKKGKAQEETVTLNGFISTSDGLIVSVADRRIKSNSKIQAFFNEKWRPLIVVNVDAKANVAVFKFKDEKDEKTQDFPTALFPEDVLPQLGARAMILRLERQEDQVFPFTTSAVINSIKDDVIELAVSRDKEKLKGAILINEKGEIIGILDLGLHGEVTVIPAKTIKDVIIED